MKHMAQQNLFFVHIPKCAGMSVRAALTRAGGEDWSAIAADLDVDEAEAARVTERGNGFDHPLLGRCHPAHLPLRLMRDQMPRTWAALTASDAFALTREPRARFLSALMQRMKEFQDAGAIRVDDPRVVGEAARVCDWLDGRGPFARIDYIHFAKQTDYAVLDGQQVVETLFPVDRTQDLARWIAWRSGLDIDVTHDHSRRQPKRWARAIQPTMRFVARRLMPQTLRRALHPIWTNSRVFDTAAKSYGTIDLGSDVEAFIARYYAGDAVLHAKATDQADSISLDGGAG